MRVMDAIVDVGADAAGTARHPESHPIRIVDVGSDGSIRHETACGTAIRVEGTSIDGVTTPTSIGLPGDTFQAKGGWLWWG